MPEPYPRRIALWAVPRSISTAFERAFLERDDTRVVHEPYSGPFYFGPERSSRRYADRDVDETQSYGRIDRRVLAPSEAPIFFLKDMALHVERHPGLDPILDAFHNTFLVRNPRRTVRSLYRMSHDTERTGWSYFDPQEVGFRQLRALYDRVASTSGRAPIVIDADDLLTSPRHIMRSYCEAIDVSFDPSMLEWQPRRIDEWQAWDGWHDAAQQSHGFGPLSPMSDEPLAPEAEAAISAAMPDYRMLAARRLGR